MSKNTVITWTCDGCEVKSPHSPTNWLQATFRRQTGENSQSLYAMLLCVRCQERMLDALKDGS